MRRVKRRENSTRLAIGLVLIAVALNVFCCRWSRVYHNSGPDAIAGLNNVLGVYAKHDPQQDTMLGVIIPSALVCVGAFFSRREDNIY